ncbi:MAG: glucose-1-phosphate cytidylyltransferase [Methanobacteriaceae archaeon]|nr:glucose-1-phosphate cytidylyltransferase [Methanobacteriaceae archaeon]
MKVVILAGGFGTRISEESYLKPKPMIEIGEKPILWHIMKIYSHFGFNEFVICLGYKAHMIKEFFADYYLHTSDVTFDLKKNEMEIHNNYSEPWKVTLVDTGLDTMTGGRIKRIKDYLPDDEPFMLTYGDGLANVDLKKLLEFHKSHDKLATITAVNLSGRFGVLDIDDNETISRFAEKTKEDAGWINGGFMVLEKEVIDYIDGDKISFEKEPLSNIACDGQLKAYKHHGFWKCMDTKRDHDIFEEMWDSNNIPWCMWVK